jgi:hypothetical protein
MEGGIVANFVRFHEVAARTFAGPGTGDPVGVKSSSELLRGLTGLGLRPRVSRRLGMGGSGPPGTSMECWSNGWNAGSASRGTDGIGPGRG